MILNVAASGRWRGTRKKRPLPDESPRDGSREGWVARGISPQIWERPLNTLYAHSYESVPVGRQIVTCVTAADRLLALTSRVAEATEAKTCAPTAREHCSTETKSSPSRRRRFVALRGAVPSSPMVTIATQARGIETIWRSKRAILAARCQGAEHACAL